MTVLWYALVNQTDAELPKLKTVALVWRLPNLFSKLAIIILRTSFVVSSSRYYCVTSLLYIISTLLSITLRWQVVYSTAYRDIYHILALLKLTQHCQIYLICFSLHPSIKDSKDMLINQTHNQFSYVILV